MNRLPYPMHLLLTMVLAALCMIEGQAEEIVPDTGETAILDALQRCRPTAEEIQTNEKQKMQVPEYMRELTEVDYRVMMCEHSARVCRATPDASECRQFLSEWRSGNVAVRR